MLRRLNVLPEHDQINVSNRTLQYRICSSDRRRTVALKVDRHGTISIHVPAIVPLPLVRQLVTERVSWILAKQALIAERSAAQQPLVSGTLIRFLGDSLTLIVEFGNRSRCRRDELKLVVTAADPSGVKRALESWFRKQAAAHFADRIAVLAPRVGRFPQRLSIRGQRSRWGSCTGRGTVSLNWRLMQFRATVVDYVIVHELCHLLVPDHSPEFWREVSRVIPGWRGQRQTLRDEGGSLVL